MYGYLPVFLGLFEPFGRDLTRSEGSLRSKHSRTKSPPHTPDMRKLEPECGKALRTGTPATQAKEKAIYISNIILSAAL